MTTSFPAIVEAHPLSNEVSVALAAAGGAGEVLLRYFGGSEIGTRDKSYLDVVTAADFESEKLVASRLAKAFPSDSIVGEEGTHTKASSDRVWFIDPLDGTFNFSRTLPFWCVSLGLLMGGRRDLGVVFDPLHEEMFLAIRGCGAWLNGTRIHAFPVRDPLTAAVQISVNFDRNAVDKSLADTTAIGKKVMRLRNMGALALELCYVGCGRLDGVAQRGSHPWDYAAAVLILEEAGGVVTNLDGSSFDLKSDDALAAATPELHRSLLSMLDHST